MVAIITSLAAKVSTATDLVATVAIVTNLVRSTGSVAVVQVCREGVGARSHRTVTHEWLGGCNVGRLTTLRR